MDILTHKIEAFIAKHRPPEEMRDQLDFSYTFEKNVLEIFEIRAYWNDPEKKTQMPIAKIKYVKTKNLWKLYWMRASGKWEAYPEMPEAKSLDACLKVVDEDKMHCFWG